MRNVFIAAVIIDVIYEIIVFRWVYPIQPFIVAYDSLREPVLPSQEEATR